MRTSTILLILLMASVPCSATAQTKDRMDQPVTAADLSSEYQSHSDSRTNVEYDIVSPKGTARSAIGTQFSRGSESFEIVGETARDNTYDPGLSDTFQRVIYEARELVPPPPGPLGASGREILVTIDFRPANVPPPPPPEQPDYFEAYVAEVTRGVCKGCVEVPTEGVKYEDKPRWEFRKVNSRRE